jgi:hypothetical protein
MNERIRKLARQAGGNPNYKAFRGHILPPPPNYIDPATVDLAKFAELIVRECVDTAFHQGHPDLEFLLKHFGVEE